MAGCSAHNSGGDSSASMKRILGYIAASAAVGAILAVIFALSAGATGLLALAIVALGAVAGVALGFFVGSAVDWFSRLKEQSPRTITISGVARCTGRNPFGFQPFSDGDWTCNMGELLLIAPSDLPVTAPGAATQTDEVRLRAAPGSGLSQAFKSFNESACDPDHPGECKTDVLHCELSALAGTFSVVGGAVGSIVGFVLGIVVGVIACIVAGIFTFGIVAAICAVIIALLAAGGAVAGGIVGSALGAFIGWLVDEIRDFDKLGETIESNRNCTLFITGRWVTDISHEHNEIHDIESVQIIRCEKIDVPKQPLGTNIVGVVAIGRQPAGHDDVPK